MSWFRDKYQELCLGYIKSETLIYSNGQVRWAGGYMGLGLDFEKMSEQEISIGRIEVVFHAMELCEIPE